MVFAMDRQLPLPSPGIERTFSAVRDALPAGERAGFDDELETIAHETAIDLAKLDEFLDGWWRIATRAAADPASWQRMHDQAHQIEFGSQSAGPTLDAILSRRE